MNLSAVDEESHSNFEESERMIAPHPDLCSDVESDQLMKCFNKKWDQNKEESKGSPQKFDAPTPNLFDSFLSCKNEDDFAQSEKNYILGKKQSGRSDDTIPEESKDHSGLEHYFEREAKMKRPSVQVGMLAKQIQIQNAVLNNWNFADFMDDQPADSLEEFKGTNFLR